MPLPVWTDSLSRGHRNTSSFSGQGLVIFKKSPQVERSWKFVEWVMTDPDANVARYLQGNSFSAYRPSWTDLRFSQPNTYFGNQNLAQLFTDIAPGMPYTVQSPLHAVIVNLLREQYFLGMVESQATPENTISEIRAAVAQMIAGQQTGKKP
jgi:ABC-type glycerol-3-phosphate transport system substrate-binding protein